MIITRSPLRVTLGGVGLAADLRGHGGARDGQPRAELDELAAQYARRGVIIETDLTAQQPTLSPLLLRPKALRRAVADWKPQLVAGQMPSEAVRLCPLFPDTFANLYASGEVSGKLDESLRHLNRLYNEDGTRKLNAFATWVPRLVYMIVALIIAYKIVQFYAGYFNAINDASKPLFR